MRRLYILTLCSIALAVATYYKSGSASRTAAPAEGQIVPTAWLHSSESPVTPAASIRSGDQTFLTFPEWYLVFSPQEQAEYFTHHTSSGFPFMSHVRQFWNSYSIVGDQIANDFPSNTGYHLMIWVIGSSTTIEYAIKQGYETVVGRLTNTETPVTDEDRFNATYTADYVRFIKDRPWYEYDFLSQLGSLWNNASFFGDHPVRKLERKYWLSSELLAKWLYGKVITLGTKAVYEEEAMSTVVVVDSVYAISPGVTIVKQNPDHTTTLSLPRYDRFIEPAVSLSLAGSRFQEIAGNRTAIVVSVIIPASMTMNIGNAKRLFSQPISSEAGKERVALVIPVPQLHELLRSLSEQHIVIEHIFDF